MTSFQRASWVPVPRLCEALPLQRKTTRLLHGACSGRVSPRRESSFTIFILLFWDSLTPSSIFSLVIFTMDWLIPKYFDVFPDIPRWSMGILLGTGFVTYYLYEAVKVRLKILLCQISFNTTSIIINVIIHHLVNRLVLYWVYLINIS